MVIKIGNLNLIRSVIYKLVCVCRLSRDALYNLYELSFDIDFVHDIHAYPNLSVIMYDPSAITTFNSLLSTATPPDLPTQQLSYDTTFKLGDFYVSVIVFRETEFTQNPVIPLAYYIHERKKNETHSHFFNYMTAVLPELHRATNAIIITDQEAAIRQAIAAAFPTVPLFMCWNHVIQVSLHLELTSL